MPSLDVASIGSRGNATHYIQLMVIHMVMCVQWRWHVHVQTSGMLLQSCSH